MAVLHCYYCRRTVNREAAKIGRHRVCKKCIVFARVRAQQERRAK